MSVTTDLLSELEQRLADAGVETPGVDVRLLAAHVIGVPTRRLPGTLDDVTTESRDRLEQLVARRAERVPLQHLTGHAPFRYLDLEVRPGVFVPRPETEVLVGAALDLLRATPGPHAVLEPCTGTGAVALSLVTEQPDVHVVASDADAAAVALASWNFTRVRRGEADVDGLQPGATLEVLEGDLLDPVERDLQGEIDLLVSNPPYLPARDRDQMPPEVAEHDPSAALFGGEDGFEVVDRLLHEAGSWLRPGGAVALEIDDRRGADAVAHARAAGLVRARVIQDLTGRDRVLIAHSPGGR